jgi:Holliday junction DNA helicase RuvA
MIAVLRGILISKSSTDAIIDCNGVGYELSISINTSEKLPEVNQEAKLFTLLVPRENALNLYGFYDTDEKEAFNLLTSVSGVGPKIALAILSSVTTNDLQEYIITGNLLSLQRMPGIGKKTAERLIVELRDKISKIGRFSPLDSTMTQFSVRDEAVKAMIALGYNSAVADKAVKQAIAENINEKLPIDILIRKSLKYALG